MEEWPGSKEAAKQIFEFLGITNEERGEDTSSLKGDLGQKHLVLGWMDVSALSALGMLSALLAVSMRDAEVICGAMISNCVGIEFDEEGDKKAVIIYADTGTVRIDESGITSHLYPFS